MQALERIFHDYLKIRNVLISGLQVVIFPNFTYLIFKNISLNLRSSMMEIPFTKEQYKALAMLVFLGNWLANATRVEPIQEFDDMQKHILSYAKQFDLPDIVEEESGTGDSYPTDKFEDELSPYIDEYNQDNFWEELIHSLAYRDLREEIGGDAFANLEREELNDKLQPHMEKYAKEFEQNGIGNLRI